MNSREINTIKNLIEFYLENHIKSNYSESTYRNYKYKLRKHVIPYIGDFKLNEIKRIDVQNLIYTLNGNDMGISGNSIRLIRTILHKALDFAVEMDLMDKNVSDKVNLPVHVNYHPRIYSKLEVDRLLDKAKGNMLYIPIILAVMIGLRRSEILALCWQDIDLNKGTITINKGLNCSKIKPDSSLNQLKSSRSFRILGIPKLLLKELKEYKEEQKQVLLQEHRITQGENTLLICKSNGASYSLSYISKKFAELLDKNDLPAIRFHDLRHAYATHAHNSGMPMKHLSRSLGHSTSATTIDNYVHINDEYSF